MALIATDKQLYEMNMGGLTLIQISAQTGLKKNTIAARIFRYRKNNGLEPKTKRISRQYSSTIVGIRKKIRTIHNLPELQAPPSTPCFSQFSATNSCRYIYGDLKNKTALFCTAEKHAGSHYCAYHHMKCTRKP